MPEYWVQLLLALLGGGLFGGIASLLNSKNSARKDEVASLRETISTLQEENARLSCNQKKLSEENVYYREWAERLCYQVISLGAVPCQFSFSNAVLDPAVKPKSRKG